MKLAADIYWAGVLIPETLMILFTPLTIVELLRNEMKKFVNRKFHFLFGSVTVDGCHVGCHLINFFNSYFHAALVAECDVLRSTLTLLCFMGFMGQNTKKWDRFSKKWDLWDSWEDWYQDHGVAAQNRDKVPL